jgi:hypothetical protein
VGPVEALTGQERDPTAVKPSVQPVAVVLKLMQPFSNRLGNELRQLRPSPSRRGSMMGVAWDSHHYACTVFLITMLFE